MFNISDGICRSMRLSTTIFILFFIFLSYGVFAGVLVPPKDLMFKHDQEYKNPDLDPEDPELKKEKPPKIYYYKKEIFKDYYYNSGKYIEPTNSQNISTNQNIQQSENISPDTTSSKKITTNNNFIIITILISILLLIAYLTVNIINRSRELNKTPIYEKYSTKPARKRRETIFDKVK
ncbi:MAG: hypothetical protein RMJ36_06600 [Candidatus Calescibacterium sp.]|nr:hypothetical protein [Candidatus Calescibacterium sp.]MDW8133305.1 hypothetical protein [Candidatus Calescibacterium sp.]